MELAYTETSEREVEVLPVHYFLKKKKREKELARLVKLVMPTWETSGMLDRSSGVLTPASMYTYKPG